MRKAFFQLHLAVFFAGFTGPLGRLITLNEGLLVWYRILFSIIVMWALTFFYKKKDVITRKQLLRLTAVGALIAIHWVAFYGSIKYSNVSIALVCFSAIGFFTAIFEPLILRTKFHPVELFLGLLTVAGIAVIFHFDPRYKTGIIVGLIAAVLASLFPIYNRKLLQAGSAEPITRYELTGGFLVLSLLMPFYLYLFPSERLVPDINDFGWLLVLSIICTVWAMYLSMRALQKISAFTVNLSYNLEPVYGILLAFLIYQENEMLSAQFYVGLSLIVFSVLLQTLLVIRSHRKEKL